MHRLRAQSVSGRNGIQKLATWNKVSYTERALILLMCVMLKVKARKGTVGVGGLSEMTTQSQKNWPGNIGKSCYDDAER
jgi:hypothetical protein